MEITLRYVEGCQHWATAKRRIEEALRRIGLDEDALTCQRIESPEEAARLDFRGSPSILIDGEDVFADDGDTVTLEERIYQTVVGPQGSPTACQIQDALNEALDTRDAEFAQWRRESERI